MGRIALSLVLASTLAACAPRGPLVTGEKLPAVPGTISGTVREAGSNAPLSARRVTAVEVATGAKYDTSTASNGGYTMQVPVGKYRLQVELRPGESIAEAPADLEINTSDLDAGRNFTIIVKPPNMILVTT
jgi:Carboxypeptidase regulatory-like domain